MAVGSKVGIGGWQFCLSLLFTESTQDPILAMADTTSVSVGTVPGGDGLKNQPVGTKMLESVT